MYKSCLINGVRSYLTDIGCCRRCILIFLCSSVDLNQTESSYDEEECNEKGSNSDNDSNCENLSCGSKRLKSFICLSCLGILQNCNSPETVSRLVIAIECGDYDAEKFSVGLSLPVSLSLRIHQIWAHLVKKFPELNDSPARTNHVGMLKEKWRSIVGPKVGSAVNKSFITGQEELDRKKFKERRKQHRKFAEGVFTKQIVESTLKEVSDEYFLRMCPDLPAPPKEHAFYSHVQCFHASLYLAGRYNKYSRELPQTPWFVEENRRFDTSVQELICGPVNKFIGADGVKFSASGREDVDVRCLGKGRPFFIEFINPRRVAVTECQLKSLQDEVNSSTDCISITDLQKVSKKETVILKEGEEEKTKSYCALCFALGGVVDDHVNKINELNELTLDQMTPLRVLHRRPLSVRKKVIHEITAQKVDYKFFKLFLKTQAGTYIKEFVHGDFGRTVPNMATLLGFKCDIVALDVENVQLDWPPPVI